VVLDIARVAADEQRRVDVVDDRGDGARQVIGLADPRQAGIGVDADPEIVGQRLARLGVLLLPDGGRLRLEPDGFDFGDPPRGLLPRPADPWPAGAACDGAP